MLTGRINTVDPAVNRSGIGVESKKPYSMNLRRFQILAGKKLYDCQDSRNDEKAPDGRVIRQGTELFPVLEEDQIVSVLVTDFEVRKGEVNLLVVDTSEL